MKTSLKSWVHKGLLLTAALPGLLVATDCRQREVCEDVAVQERLPERDGNVGGNTDTLTIVDTGDATGDTVLLAVAPSTCFVLAVLTRAEGEPAELRLTGDLTLRLARGRFTVVADEGVELATGARIQMLAGELGVSLWAVFVVVPTGRAGASLLLGASGVERLLEELAEIAATAPFDVKTTAAPHFRRVLLQRKQRDGARGLLRDIDENGVVRGPRGITDGVGFVFVSHRGEIFPSGFLPLRAGDVRADDLATVYRTHPLFTGLRDADALGGKCGACPFRRVCGGSRARAWAMHGDVMAEDPLCVYVPRGYEKG